MTKVIDLSLHFCDTELLIQEITTIQAETLLGGYCQLDENYPYTYIINITKFPSQRKKTEPEIKPQGTVMNKEEINSIDESRKIYINGVPVKGEKNIIIIY